MGCGSYSVRWALLGKTPPPFDGQALATRRLLELLDPEVRFLVVSSSPRGPGVRAANRFGLGRLREVLHYVRQARDALRAHPYPILYANFSGTPLGHLRDVLTFRWAIPRNRIVLIWPHNALGALFRNPLLGPSARALGRRAAHWIALNRAMLQDLRVGEVPTSRIRIIPNAIEEALIPDQEALARKIAQAEPDRLLRLLFVGRLGQEKGVDLALEALARLRARGLQAVLTCVGPWPAAQEAEGWRSWLERHGLSACVRLLGEVRDRSCLLRLYLEHHVLLFPTRYPWESQPLVVLEALASGCPVVSTPVGGIPELVLPGQHGALVPIGDPEALAEALLAYQDRAHWRAQARAARAYFEAHFDPGRIRDGWLELLRAYADL